VDILTSLLKFVLLHLLIVMALIVFHFVSEVKSKIVILLVRISLLILPLPPPQVYAGIMLDKHVLIL